MDVFSAIVTLGDLPRRPGVCAGSRVVFAGHVAAGLVDEIARTQPSFVAMVAQPHGRLERVPAGSVTMDVVHDAPVPVIVPGSAGI